MRIERLEVGPPVNRIGGKSKLFELRNCQRQGLSNFLKPGVSGARLGLCNALQKSLTKGIVLQQLTANSVCILKQLRDQMEIRGLPEKLS